MCETLTPLPQAFMARTGMTLALLLYTDILHCLSILLPALKA